MHHFSVSEQGFAVIVYNEQESQMIAKTYLHIHANTIVHNNLIEMKPNFRTAVCKLYF